MAHCAEIQNIEPQTWQRRRRHPRHTLRSLAYVKLDNGNGGIVRDLTESGVAIQAVAPLHVGQEVGLRFDLLAPRVRVETRGRVAWADANGQAGIPFQTLLPRLHGALKDWLLQQMLSSAAVSGSDTIFDLPDPQLIVSHVAVRTPIVMETIVSEPSSQEQLRVRWGWFALSVRAFSLWVDLLVLLCAVLLFAISSLAVMGRIPAWPLAAALLLTSTAIFAAAYQLVFSDFLCGATPGKRLAALATGGPGTDDPAQRFR